MTAAFAPQPEQAQIRAETPFDAAVVEVLVEHAFGPGRFAKTAERLREGSTPVAGWIVERDGRPVGTVRLWPIHVGETRALFLGPIAVAADERRGGVGAQLIQAAAAESARRGLGVLLVGDIPYFGRFGFVIATEAYLPGPVDRRRVLWRGEKLVSGPAAA